MDSMNIDPVRGQDAVSAARDAVDARVSGTGVPGGSGSAPPLVAAAFGQGLGAKGTAVAELLAGAHGVRTAHLERLRGRLGVVETAVRRIAVADDRTGETFAGLDARGGAR